MSELNAGSCVSESKACLNSNETDNDETVKRKLILTGKVRAYKAENVQKGCKARANKMKSVVIALKELMRSDDHAPQVQTQ